MSSIKQCVEDLPYLCASTPTSGITAMRTPPSFGLTYNMMAIEPIDLNIKKQFKLVIFFQLLFEYNI